MTLSEMQKTKGRGRRNWQDEAWRQYDMSGLLRAGVRWKSNSMSRATLFIAKGDTDVPEPERVDAGQSVDLLDQLFDGPGGQSQMLSSLGHQLSVPGECYLVGYTDPLAPGVLRWVIASNKELTTMGDRQILDRGDGRKIQLTDADWILRIWNSHPQRWWWPDSPVIGLLGDLKELEALAQHVIASVDSRLAGAGILLLPQEMSFPSPANPELHADQFTATLVEAMTTPLQNRDSAAAVVPIVVRVPAETIKEAKHISFATPLDERIPKMREDAIRRIALGLDMPPEVLLGMADANHWSSWQISDEGVKLHIEPDLATVCDALTQAYLWPQTGDTSETIWFDTSELTENPNRGPDAATVFEARELSGDAFRAHHGFSDAEKPSDEERTARILLDLAGSNPQLAVTILEYLKLVPTGLLTPPAPVQITSTRPDRDEAEEADQGDTGPPDTEDEEQPGRDAAAALVASGEPSEELVASCNIGVTRALEQAGKRFMDRSRRHSAPDIPLWMMHTRYPVPPTDHDRVLHDAWSTFTAGAPHLAYLVPALDTYVRMLLERGCAHDPSWLVDVVKRGVRDAAALA
jgi:hypothetical protein